MISVPGMILFSLVLLNIVFLRAALIHPENCYWALAISVPLLIHSKSFEEIYFKRKTRVNQQQNFEPQLN